MERLPHTWVATAAANAVHQRGGFRIDVLQLWILPAIHHLHHADENQIVFRIDPPPGAGVTGSSKCHLPSSNSIIIATPVTTLVSE